MTNYNVSLAKLLEKHDDGDILRTLTDDVKQLVKVRGVSMRWILIVLALAACAASPEENRLIRAQKTTDTFIGRPVADLVESWGRPVEEIPFKGPAINPIIKPSIYQPSVIRPKNMDELAVVCRKFGPSSGYYNYKKCTDREIFENWKETGALSYKFSWEKFHSGSTGKYTGVIIGNTITLSGNPATPSWSEPKYCLLDVRVMDGVITEVQSWGEDC